MVSINCVGPGEEKDVDWARLGFEPPNRGGENAGPLVEMTSCR